MKTLAYMPLHYGADYLLEACRSVLPAVDEFLILYTPHPSYGHKGRIPLPKSESRDQLFKLYESLNDYPEAGAKLSWIDVNSNRENEHRETGHRYAREHKFDMSIAVDSDEVWDTESVFKSLDEAQGHHAFMTTWKGWKHFYRSFNEYCTDGFQPVRIFNYNNKLGSTGCVDSSVIYHMGYAIREELMAYKLSCHGHKNEMNPGFYNEWANYNRKDWQAFLDYDFTQDKDWTLHPVSKQVWIETKLQDVNELPDLLKNHKFFGLEKI